MQQRRKFSIVALVKEAVALVLPGMMSLVIVVMVKTEKVEETEVVKKTVVVEETGMVEEAFQVLEYQMVWYT